MLLGYERLCLNTSTGEYTDHFSINNFGNQENILNFFFRVLNYDGTMFEPRGKRTRYHRGITAVVNKTVVTRLIFEYVLNEFLKG